MESLWKVIQAAVAVIVGSDDNDVDFRGDSPSSVPSIFDSSFAFFIRGFDFIDSSFLLQ